MAVSITVADLQLNEKAEVTGFSVGCDKSYCRKLMSMGVLPNTPISLVRVAPLGDPIEIRLRDYQLTLRREEARCIHVRRL